MQSNAEIRHNRPVDWNKILLLMAFVLFLAVFSGEWGCNRCTKNVEIHTLSGIENLEKSVKLRVL